MPARCIASNTFCATNSESCETSPAGGIELGFVLGFESKFRLWGRISVEGAVNVKGVEDEVDASVFEDESKGVEVRV